MAATYDSGILTEGSGNPLSSSVDRSVTIANQSDRVIYCAFWGDSLSGITVTLDPGGGNELSLSQIHTATGPTTGDTVYLYRAVAPAVGTFTLRTSWSAGDIYSLTTFGAYGVDQTTPETSIQDGTRASDTSIQATATGTTSGETCWLVTYYSGGATSLAPNGSEIERGDARVGLYEIAAGGTSQSMQADLGSARDNIGIAFQLNPASSATEVALTGNQPAPSGAIAPVVIVPVAGNQPNPTGLLSLLGNINLVGNQPNATGVVISLEYAAVAGNQPNATGDIASQVAAILAGDQPNATGLLSFLAHINLAGNQPAATGDVISLEYVALAGDQPNATGEIAAQVAAALAGNQPNATGALSFLAHIALAGAQDAPSGLIAFLQSVFLTGDQPNATGVIADVPLIALGGSQDAPSGVLTLHGFIALAGDQPNGTGVIVVSTSEALAGDQPEATGELIIVVGSNVALAGDQPAATGALSITIEFRRGFNTRVVRPARRMRMRR